MHFIQYLPAVFLATLGVGLFYIIWDVVAVRKGHWRFNEEFTGTFHILHLPPGEWLFFLLIPYPCIFIFEVTIAYFDAGSLRLSLVWLQYALSGLFMLGALSCRKRGYSFLAMFSTSLFFLASGIFTPAAVFTSGYLLSFCFIFLAFLVVNGLYTSLPTIFYNEDAIFGMRIGSIPVEDFFYNLSYAGFVLTFYLPLKDVFLLG